MGNGKGNDKNNGNGNDKSNGNGKGNGMATMRAGWERLSIPMSENPDMGHPVCRGPGRRLSRLP